MRDNKPIVEYLTDSDLYKYTMQQTFLHQFPAASGTYRFKCRNKGVKLGKYADQVREEVMHLCSLEYSPRELDFLGKRRFLTKDYIEFLRLFRFNKNGISIEDRNGELVIEAEGSLVHTMPFEIHILSIVSEVYTRNEHPQADYGEAERRLREKIAMVKAYPDAGTFKFADFGGRRRFSRQWHRRVVEILANELPDSFVGTSNVFLAMEFGITPIGTMAHEYLQAFQALGPRLVDSQRIALDSWSEEFRGDLGIALTDVVGIDAFLRDLDLKLAKLFDGFRHDSGPPILWGWKVIQRLNELRINPLWKTAVYSDGLTMRLALSIHALMRHAINPTFGIGTHLTNDFGVPALNIVMKLVHCNGQPVAKISDSPGKGMCDDENFLRYLAQVYQVTDPQVSEVAL